MPGRHRRGDAEGLVQVHVADVGADVGRRVSPTWALRLAPSIDLAAVGMNDGADLANVFLEHAVGGRIGDHQGGSFVLVLFRLVPEVGDIDVAVFVASTHHDHVHAGHLRGGRVGAVGRLRDQADIAMASPRLAW